MKLLLVDDDDISLEAARRVLSDAGYEVLVARDGQEALDIIRAGVCRLVISDWAMPGMDGLALCRQVRTEELPGYVYFILLTSRESKDDMIAGLSAGADDFIAKPFHPAELCVRVRTGERILSLETRDMAIFAMAKLAESRDPETGAHLERVRCYARLIAGHLAGTPRYRTKINEEFVRLIYLTSPLHDIGKVGIPDCVLLKPGRLTDREFEIMKTHTTIGAATLDAALRQYPGTPFLRMARDIALTHHERFDGKGYPNGLAAREIPLCGRIVALADAYDALTSRRVYKQAYGHEVARSVILDESGVHFDPDVVDAFIENEAAFLSEREQFSEMSLATT